jgi:hypothetical protein
VAKIMMMSQLWLMMLMHWCCGGQGPTDQISICKRVVACSLR